MAKTTQKTATKETQSYADRVRGKLIKKAESAAAGGNKLDFSPGLGTHRIRILPPIRLNDKGKLVEDTEGLFYCTHSYHWIPADINDIKGKKGKYLWTRKFYDVKGGTKKDPIDEAVTQFYSVGRKEDDKDLLNLGGVLKRKRNYFCHIILYTEEGPQYRVLVDRSNEGKLMRLMCAAMGIPFWRDTEDNWVAKDSGEIDPDKDYYDLIDIEAGHDLKIVKKKTGVNDWDISYEESFVMKSPRALNKQELELLNERVDLATYVTYEENYDIVKSEIEKFIGDGTDDTDDKAEEVPNSDEEENPKKATSNSSKKSKKEAANEDEPVEENVDDSNDDEDIEEMLNELDDDDDDNV